MIEWTGTACTAGLVGHCTRALRYFVITGGHSFNIWQGSTLLNVGDRMRTKDSNGYRRYIWVLYVHYVHCVPVPVHSTQCTHPTPCTELCTDCFHGICITVHIPGQTLNDILSSFKICSFTHAFLKGEIHDSWISSENDTFGGNLNVVIFD